MLSSLIKIIILVFLLAVIGFIGLSIWSSACSGPDTGQLEMPSEEDAAYSMYIKNTGGLLFTNDYEQHGQVVGSRIFVLHGFWEMRGKDFKFVDGDIVLDENIFGEIVVEKRDKD